MRAFERWLIWGSSVATGLTGVVYAWMKYMMEPVNEWAVINHPLQPWVLKAHIIVAPLLVFAVGVVTVDHVWRHYRSGVRIGRGSGISMMWLVAPMVLTGYLIQAVTHAGWLTALVWAHLITGGLYLAGLLWHHLVFRRRRRVRRRLGGARWEAVGRVDVEGRRGPGAPPVPSRGAVEGVPEDGGSGPDRGTGVAPLNR